MSMNRILILAIAASFVVFGHIQTTTAGDLTVESYLGKWYTLAIAVKEQIANPISCNEMTVTRGDSDNTIRVVSGGVRDGKPYNLEAIVNVENPNVHIINPSTEHETRSEIVGNVNNGEDLLFGEKFDSHIYYKLISRKTTASQEIMDIMNEKAASAGLQVFSTRESDCA